MRIFHLTGSALFLVVWFAGASLIPFKGESGLSFEQVTFINIASHVPALSSPQSDEACLFALLPIGAAGSGNQNKISNIIV